MSCLSSATLLGRWGPPCNPTSGYPREFWSRPCSTTARTTWGNNSTHQWSCGRQNYCLELFDQQRGRTGSQDTASLETVDEKCPFVHWPTFLILLPTCLLSAIISNPIPSGKSPWRPSKTTPPPLNLLASHSPSLYLSSRLDCEPLEGAWMTS